MDWTLFLGSLAGVLGLAALARLLKLGETRIATPEQARAMAELLVTGFDGGRALCGTDGRGAIVAGQILGNGVIILMKRHGAKVAARTLYPPLGLRAAVEGVTVETGERMFGAVTLFGVTEDEVRAVEQAAQAGQTPEVVTLH